MKKLYKGLKTDNLLNDQEEGSWSDARNIVVYKKRGAISNEDGFDNVTPVNYPNKFCIGSIVTNSVKILFFGSTNPADSEIGKINSNGTYTCIIKDSILNFNQNFPIQGTFDNKFNNNTIIAWTDNYNNLRILNIDCIPFSVNSDGTIPIGEKTKANILLSLFPNHSTPIINKGGIFTSEGAGNLSSGAYYPIFCYGLEDKSFTFWSKIYNGVPVYVDDKGERGNLYDGTTQVGGSIGGETTRKYITLKIDNIDINFKYLKIGYLYVKNGETFAFEVKTLSINNSTSITTNLTGTESTLTQISLEDVLIPKAIYSKAKSITSFQKELEIAHLTEPAEIEFQQYANLINVRWTRGVSNDDNAIIPNTIPTVTELNSAEAYGGIYPPGYKNEATVFFDKTFKAGECYALYIFFNLTNGTKSKGFHIPGRDVIVGDRTVQVGANFNDLDNSANVYKYQVFDTSISTVTGIGIGDPGNGNMGFWENETEEYPLDPNNPLAIHPDYANIPGISVANRKVRHHVFPDIKKIVDTEQLYNGSPNVPVFCNPGGIASYAEYAGISSVFATDAEQYHIYFQSSTSVSPSAPLFTYSSLAGPNRARYSGFAIAANLSLLFSFNQDLSKNNEGNTVSSLGGIWQVDIVIVKNGTVFSSYYAIINSSKVLEVSTILSQNMEVIVPVNPGDNVDITYRIYTSLGTGSFSSPFTYNQYFANLTATLGVSTPPVFSALLGLEISNINIPPSLIGLVDSYEIGYAKRTNDNIRIIGQDMMKEERFHNFDLLTNRLSLRPSYLKPLVLYPVTGAQIGDIPLYGALNVLLETPHPINEIESVSKWIFVGENTTFPVGNNNKSSSLFCIAGSGQTAVSYLQTKYGKTNTLLDICLYKRDVYKNFEEQEIITTGRNFKITNSGVQTTKRIFGGDTFVCMYGFKDALDGTVKFNIVAEFSNNVSLRIEDLKNGYTYYPKSNTPTPSWYGHNKDMNCFNEFNKIDIYYPIKDCLNDVTYFPQRIAQSIKDGTENVKLNWRTFKINSYYDIPKNKGVIWNILASDRILYIHTELSLFIADIKDRLATNTGEVYLGISELFERPPIEVLTVNEGYAGTQSQYACILCKLGYCFIDKNAGKVFIYKPNQGLVEISNQGMYNFFQKHSKSFDNTVDNPFIDNGYVMGFDEKYNRLIISKNDFTSEALPSSLYDFCLSYSPDLNEGRGGWVSFHDYNPNVLLYNRDGVFSIKNTINNIFKHNSLTTKAIYYTNDIKNSSIDYVENEQSNITKRFDSLNWISTCELNNIISKKTFTHLMVFNDTQCSGIIDLNASGGLWFGDDARNMLGTWNYNDFRDLVNNINLPFLDDKNQLISTNINNSKAWFNKSRFISKFAVFRLIFNNVNQNNLHLTLIGTNFIKSSK